MKDPGEADAYLDVKVNYISGKKPEFVVFEDGIEVSPISLPHHTTLNAACCRSNASI